MGKVTPPLERFMRLVEHVDGHWVWTGHLVGSKSRRPRFRHTTNQRDPQVYAHRWIYEQLVGQIPEGYEVDHTCKVGTCVNPDHLEAVTPQENQRRQRLAVCKNGHALTLDNRKFDKLGRSRGCKTCERDRWSSRYAETKAAKQRERA